MGKPEIRLLIRVFLYLRRRKVPFFGFRESPLSTFFGRFNVIAQALASGYFGPAGLLGRKKGQV
jgi:hypothetical protein